MGDSSKDEWWRHDGEPDTRERGRQRAQSQSERERAQRRRTASTATASTPTASIPTASTAPRLSSRTHYSSEAERELRRHEAIEHVPEGVTKRGGHPHVTSGPSVRPTQYGQRSNNQQLGRRAGVPQLRNSTASRGGWDLPSLGKVNGSGIGESAPGGLRHRARSGRRPSRLLALAALALAIVLLVLAVRSISGSAF